MILGYEEGVTACRPYDEDLGHGCQAESCDACVLVRFLCVDCEQYGKCDYKHKPKILPSNRVALSLYSKCQKFGVMPFSGGVMDQQHYLLAQFDIIMDEMAKQEKIIRDNLEKNK